MQTDKTSKLLGAAGIGFTMVAVGAGALMSMKRKGRAPDDAPGYAARRGFGDFAVVGRTVTIRKPRQDLFDFWREFSNLASFMENVERIDTSRDAGHSTWTIKAPAGQTLEVKTEIVREDDGKLIAWRSIEGSEIETEGRVTFEDAPGDRGTRVGLIVAYKPPAGALGRAIASLSLREPEQQARHDLKRFKMLMETGEIATSARRKDETRAAKQENDE